MLKGITVTVEREQQVGEDDMGEPVTKWVPEHVDNVLWIQHASQRLAGNEYQARPDAAENEVKLHFPKTYTESLVGCRVNVCGRTYNVIGDPVGYMPKLTPGKWNRPVVARRADG